MHYSQPVTKEKRMGRKRTTLPTDSSAAECTGCQTKSFDVFNRPWSDIYNSGSRKVNSAHWFTRPTQCLEIRCCCTGLRSCGLAYWLPKRSSCSDWQCSHKTETFSGANLNFFVLRVMPFPLAAFYMRKEIWISFTRQSSSTFWKLMTCSNATSGHRLDSAPESMRLWWLCKYRYWPYMDMKVVSRCVVTLKKLP